MWVAGIDEVRGRAFDIVFLPGLCEGLFPSRPHEDPILLDDYRRKLNAGLRVQDDRVADERRRLHMACAAARKRLVFSYPRVDAVESRPRVPSFYALEIVRAAHGRLPDLRTFEEKARRAAPSRLDWPAPADAREAIDDAEFDLATLGRTGRPKARGHYLIEANRYLAESLRRHGRRHRAAWFSADGLVKPDEATRAVLATQRLAARSYSPSALQHFAPCPYRFLLYAIYSFRPRDEKVALEQMDPLTRGALFHEAQFQLFRELQTAQLLPMRPANQARVTEIADRVLDRVAAENEEKLAPAIPRVWRRRDRRICAPICAAGSNTSPRPAATGCRPISNSALACLHGDGRDPAQHSGRSRARRRRAPARRHRSDRETSGARHAAHHRP